MPIVKTIAVTATIYGFLAYVIACMFKPSLPFPVWAVGVYFALVIPICIWALERDNDLKAKIWAILALWGILGGTVLLYMVARVF